MAKVIRKELEAKLAALGGEEWDSMSEGSVSGNEDGAQVEGELKPPPLPLRAQKKKKGAKKGKAAGASVVPVGPAGEPSGVVYVGHIPHGFYEEAMNGFFKQFGDVIRVRISRSKKSARCKVRDVGMALPWFRGGVRLGCFGSAVCTLPWMFVFSPYWRSCTYVTCTCTCQMAEADLKARTSRNLLHSYHVPGILQYS